MQAEKFTNHIVFEKLEQFEQALSTETAKEKISIEHFSFFETAYLFIADRLKLTIPVLVQEAELNQLASDIDQGTVQVNNFLGNNNTGHITNAMNNFNSALNRVRNFPMPLSKGDFNFSKAIASFQETVIESYKVIDGRNKELQGDLEKIQRDLESEIAQIATLQQRLDAKETEIQNILNNYNTQFETIKTSNSATFNAQQKKFNDTFEADRKTFKELTDTDKALYKEEYEKQKTDLEDKTSETVQNLQSKLEEAKRIVNVVGDVGITGKYQEIAKKQGKAANIWRVIAFASMLIMCILLIYTIWDISKASYDITKSIIRIIAALALSYPATYASKESSKFRALEIKNKSLELELTSLNPFIELLPEDKKQGIKEKLVEKYFGNSNHYEPDIKDGSKEELSISGFERILKILSGFIHK